MHTAFINFNHANRGSSLSRLLKYLSRRAATRPRTPRGFTLIELMVSVAVLGLLTALAIPSFASLLQRKQIEAFNNEFRASINYARQQAQRTGQRTTVCKRVPGQNVCATNGAQGWEAGWLVFHDVSPGFASAASTDNNNVLDTGAGETLLKVKDAVTAFTASTAGPGTQTLQPYIAFNGQGLNAATTSFCVKSCALASCAPDRNNAYLIVTSAGHARIESEDTISQTANTGNCS